MHAISRASRRWRALLAAGAAAAVVPAGLLTAGQDRPAHAAPAPPSGFTTIWSDDFDGAGGTLPSSANWLFDTGTGYPGGADHWGTGEVETMTNSPNNVSLDGNGHLAIRPVRDASGNWTSARIETQRTDFQPPPGGVLRVEASIQQPNVNTTNGLGYWPAFWMLGAPARPVGATNWPSIGEIDIMEDINGRSSEFGTFHCGTDPGGPCDETTGIGSGERGCAGCQTGFHTYAMELDYSTNPQQIRWYLDGNNFFTVNANQVDQTTWNNATQHGFFVILNVAMGGGFPAAFGGGPTSATVSGQPMLVDYVSVATKGGSGGTTTTTAPSSGTTSAYGTIQAESASQTSGLATESTMDTSGGQDLGQLANGAWAEYPNVDFGATPATQFHGRVASGAAGGVSGLVEVRLDRRDSAPIGSFAVANTGGWQSWRTIPANIAATTGVHTVYLTFTSGQPAPFVSLNWFDFAH
ncbi:glycoside hydrolase family 16 protein [Gandjariella thermophila]|uniref:Endo-1,3-beta-glucanase n=1 Tax=Gandjariella thermophila TaxID=1931992 RepID=A0A4D4J9Q5_9PSEU|nr:glycoside hydrolase family 16 protein [Gandjariella thermophila]GDY32294.1 endo-1,3-beta-glucanase [Gandjariella thermophila]